MLKEQPGELNRKLKRMQSSRDNLKENNKEKSQQNKKLRDRNVEINESRDMWRSRCQKLEKELERQKEELKLQIEAANKVIEEEKIHVGKERERTNLLQAEVEEVKKKFKILKALSQK